MIELIGSLLILTGAVFLFSAGLGLVRMPDAYTRIQAGTKATTLGNILIVIGLAFYHPEWTLKLVLVDLLRPDDQSRLLACAVARRLPDPHADDLGNHDGRAGGRREGGRSGESAHDLSAGVVLLAVILFATDLPPPGRRLCRDTVDPSSACGTLCDAGPHRTRRSPTSSPASSSPIAASTRWARLPCFSWSRPASACCSRRTTPSREGPEGTSARVPASEIVTTGTQVLLPLIFTFGAYVIVNGHLSAGGGFQGGAIVASGVMLLLLARPGSTAQRRGAQRRSNPLPACSMSRSAFSGWSWPAASSTRASCRRAKFGAFISAGAIPLISALLGIKVGAELSVIIDRFRS